MKYTAKKVKEITDLIKEADHTIEDICKKVNVSKSVFYAWKSEKQDFMDALKEAEAVRLQKFMVSARRGLLVLLEGKTFDEVTAEYKTEMAEDGTMREVLISKKVVTKFVQPNATSVIFALKNTDPDSFRDVQIFTGKDGGPIEIKNETTLIRRVVFKTRETTAAPQVLTEQTTEAP